MYWRVGDDPRLDPDYEPIPHPHAIECEECGLAIEEGEEYYEIAVGRTVLNLCPVCAKKWLEDQRRVS